MTKQELLNAAEKKGFKTEIQSGDIWKNMIGVCPGNHIWYWFKGDDDLMMFDHSYNQNNGRTIKGWKTGFNFQYKKLLS